MLLINKEVYCVDTAAVQKYKHLLPSQIHKVHKTSSSEHPVYHKNSCSDINYLGGTNKSAIQKKLYAFKTQLISVKISKPIR